MFQRHARSLVFAASLLATVAAQAAGHVEAVAGNASDVQDGPGAVSASAADGGYTASSTRTASITSASISGGNFTDFRGPARARSWSDFTVVGLDSTTALTFLWAFSGSRSWNADNASVGIAMSVRVSGPSFIDEVGWGINYVDGPVALGDFAGTLSNPFGVSAAGTGYSNTLSADTWDGQGTRFVGMTMQWAVSGAAGGFIIDVNGGTSGEVIASNSLVLASLTVPEGTAIAAGGAWLVLDDGSRLAISAVPEPQAWVLFAGGLALVGWRLRQR